MSELYPLMMMNEDRYCDKAGVICECKESKSDSLLKIMLLTGGSFLGNSPQQNLFFLLFNDDDGCTCTKEDGSGDDTCLEDDIKGKRFFNTSTDLPTI